MTKPKDPTPPAETEAPAAPAEKRARRRLTPEQRIAEREAEIKAIKEQQRARVREKIAEAGETLRACALAAESAGMQDEAKRCVEAHAALTGSTSMAGGA